VVFCFPLGGQGRHTCIAQGLIDRIYSLLKEVFI